MVFDSPMHGFQEKVLKMGWVRTKINESNWIWKYFILTDYELNVFDKAPVSQK